MKIAIFGGSFNPPHKMHKEIALELIKNKYVDHVIYVPTGNKYLKKDLIDAKERLEMLKIMTQNNKNLSVSDYEMKNNLTYTYQTLDYFQKMYPNDEIYFICGTDNLKEITTWKNYNYILQKYKIVVIERNQESSEEIIKNLPKNHLIITKFTTQNISSTKIREELKRNKNSLNLEEEVKNYIQKRNLYI